MRRTCIISINRLIYISRINPDDMTWSLGPAAIFSIIEPSMAVTLASVPLIRPLLGIRRRRLDRRRRQQQQQQQQPPMRRIGVGNKNSLLQRTHRYDPDFAGRMKLRPDRVEHRAEISATGGGSSLCGGGGGGGGDSGGIAVPERSYDSSGSDLKGEIGPEITVNRQWKVTREVGEWTQILGGR